MESQINGIPVFHIDEGERSAPPVVFVHGMTFDHRMWLPQIETFSRDHRVIAYDLRGHGKSGAGDGQFTYRHLADDLAALLDHLVIEKAVLCGLSMGGAVAFRTFEIYPERVSGLVLCDTSCFADTNESRQRRELTIQSIKRDGLKPFTDIFVPSVFAAATFERHPEVIASIRETILSSSPLGICGALLAQMGRTDTCSTLAEINVPTLFMVGSEDALTPPSVVEDIHSQVQGSGFRVIPGAAHIPNLENPEAFNRELRVFLESMKG